MVVRPRKNVLLVTGSSGLLGANLAMEAPSEHQVVLLDQGHLAPPVSSPVLRCDLTERDRVIQCLDSVRPDVIVHCAAIVDVERCELEPESAERINVHAVATLADWAGERGARLVYISTDSVFDGEVGLYSEEDAPRPLNHYARTKLAGENAARAQAPKALIVRTNFHGWNLQEKLSLSEWVLRGLLHRERLTMFTDVRFSPLLVNDLARIILDLVSLEATGTYHVAARDDCSKHEFALLVGEVFGLKTDTLVPISVDNFPFKARRPKNTSLRVEKTSNFLGRAMPSVEEGLLSFKVLLDDGYVTTLKGHEPNWLLSAEVS